MEERNFELTVLGKSIVLVSTFLLIIGLLIENYFLIIPGSVLLVLVCSTFFNYFYFHSMALTAEIKLSKEYMRNRALLAVVVNITNKSDRALIVKVKLNYSYHFIPIDIPKTIYCTLKPNSTIKKGWYLLASRRGNALVGRITVSYGLFQNLFINEITIGSEQRIKILPMRPRIQVPWKTKKDLLLKMVNEFAQRIKGQGDEFFALRDYQPGDEFRHIAWYATAKRGDLITKEFEDLKNLHFLIYLDLGSTMFGPKFDYALSSIVELSNLIKGTNHDLAVIAYSSTVKRFIIPQVGINELKLMLNLYDLESSGVSSDFFEAVKFTQTQKLYHSIAIVFSDLDGDIFRKVNGLQYLSNMDSRIIFVNYATPDFNILASENYKNKTQFKDYDDVLNFIFPSLVEDEYDNRKKEIQRILRAVNGDYVEINGYDDNIILALYRLMKKYVHVPRMLKRKVK